MTMFFSEGSAPVKARLETETGATIPFMFNPETITVQRNVTWTDQSSPGENAPQQVFTSGAAGTMSFSLTLDTTDTGAAVTTYTSRLLALTNVNTEKKRPLWVQLFWGDTKSFKAVITGLTLKYTYFAANGDPLRATVDINLKQFKDEGQYPLQNPTSGTRRSERIHRVLPGETLDRISYVVYGDPTQWRLIAHRNGIQDPFRLPAGLALVVPEREPLSREATRA